MRPSRVWYNRMKPAVQKRGYAREAYDRQGNGERLMKLAQADGFVAEMRGGFVHVSKKRVVALASTMCWTNYSSAPVL